jgi:hypothetical protein
LLTRTATPLPAARGRGDASVAPPEAAAPTKRRNTVASLGLHGGAAPTSCLPLPSIRASYSEAPAAAARGDLAPDVHHHAPPPPNPTPTITASAGAAERRPEESSSIPMRRRRRPSRSSGATMVDRWADDNSATVDSGDAVAVIELRDGTPKGMDWLGFYYDTRLTQR